LRAGLLDLGTDALLAGRAVAALYRLDGFTEGPLEFFVPRWQRDRSTTGLVRSGPAVAPTDRATVEGFAVTSAALTIIHLAAHASRREVANALDSATRLRLVTPDSVQRRLDSLRHRGVGGIAMLDDVLREAGVESWLERRFLELVRSAGLPEPALQRIYKRGTQHVARVDFDFAPASIVVEVGGQKGYLTREERQRQERRRSQLQLLGKIVYFFSHEDVAADPRYVMDTLRAALERAA
jgi:very-short-patch-repair endonuclease